MLTTAIESELPIIEITTTDLVYLVETLNAILGLQFSRFNPAAPIKEKYTYHIGTLKSPNLEALYPRLLKAGCSLILVNSEAPSLSAFNAGSIAPTVEALWELLKDHIGEDKKDETLNLLKGSTLKDVGEYIRLSKGLYGKVEYQGLKELSLRNTSVAKGVESVSTLLEFYSPPQSLQDWLEVDGKFFKDSPHKSLVPRGLMFYGEAGTGKTLGAKYLANTLGVPLYRLNMGEMMGKYVGESEGNMETALRYVIKESPSVLLIDEVEKVFNDKDDNGVQFRLLSQLLWWLQEHNSSVLTIMTTNDYSILPPELYREGRIDKKFKFSPLNASDADSFAKRYLTTLNIVEGGTISIALHEDSTYTPATIVQRVLQAVKLFIIDKGGV